MATPTEQAYVLGLIRENFGGFTFWDRVEPDIVSLCAALPPVIEGKKLEYVSILESIKDRFIDEGVIPKELLFLDEEISRLKETRQMGVFVEEYDEMPQKEIDIYSRTAMGKEGFISIPPKYNFSQLRKLTNGVYQNTGLVKIFVSREKTVYGKVTAEIFEHPQTFPLATVVHYRGADGLPDRNFVALFGDEWDKKRGTVMKQVKFPLRVYRFIGDDKKEYYLLSADVLDMGDYIIAGTLREVDEHKLVTESARILTKLPFLFVQQATNRAVKFSSGEQMFKVVDAIRSRGVELFKYPFMLRQRDEYLFLKQPEWFMWLIWAWLAHSKKGMHPYPLHLLLCGSRNAGKTSLIEALYQKSGESPNIFSGAESTLKNLIPSFKNHPARMGYLAESNRFAFLDEFLRCIGRAGQATNGRDESVGMMNDLLEHRKRDAGSGVSRIFNVGMTARIMSSSNPIRGLDTVEDMLHGFDEAWLSRWLIYFYHEDREHTRMIRKSNDFDIERRRFEVDVQDWLGIIDYLQGFDAEYDLPRVVKVMDGPMHLMSDDMKNHYDARHKHHIECLMDGLVKVRCLLERDPSFRAEEEDYRRLAEVWGGVVSSWINSMNIMRFPVGDRIHYLPTHAQFCYRVLVGEKRPLSSFDWKELCLKGVTSSEMNEAVHILEKHELVFEEELLFRPHYMKERQKDD